MATAADNMEDLECPKFLAHDGDSAGDNVRQSQPTPKVGWQEKFECAKKYKENGNEKYKTREYRAAIGQYHRAILYLKGIDDAQKMPPILKSLSETDINNKGDNIPDSTQHEIQNLKSSCYNNLAACILHSPKPSYEKVVEYCDNVIEIQPNNLKASYRKGVALYHLKKVDEALQILQAARQMPGGERDPEIRKYMKLCEKDIVTQEDSVKTIYKAMFNTTDRNTSTEQT